jgi:cyclopropane fatty-acyl-phospholipid synthase-like methyltransferase
MTHIPSGDDKISNPARIAVSFLQKNLNQSKQFTLLDIGCGEGRDIYYISANFDNLTIKGIDISLKAIEKAIDLNSNKKNVTFQCMDWKDLDDTQYDIIYMSGVYHFFNLAERTSIISKIRKILKINGFFFLTALSSSDTQYYGKGVPVPNDPNSFQSEFFLHFCSKEELQADFKFLKIFDLFEFFHKNYSKDIEYHTMWLLIGKNTKKRFRFNFN